ncbi:hypothetical protein J5N97_023413 [Dioscorea zingiberensis]|uniref:Lysine-specific demethylase JMJ16 n=1 Tax=Dioscorea zingiberensis TaxID=325984 RepID=A0A9D5H7T1_9LILI|nr:hypothetical protein J5N97_023413 [Dioscorea zingiberensis]
MASAGTLMGEGHSGCVKVGSVQTPRVPPGFTSFSPFTLKRVREDDKNVARSSNSMWNQMDIDCSIFDNEKLKKSLHHRPWLNYSQLNDGLEGESESEPVVQGVPSVPSLPKGIIHGCVKCGNCQEVMARWRPENARIPILDDAPVFYPTEEEFKDQLQYISSIRLCAEPYGICRIVPPPSWRPPCPLKEKHVWENSKFPTRIQQLDKLQNHECVKRICGNHTIKSKRQKLWKSGPKFGYCAEHAVGVNKPGHHNNNARFGFEAGPCFTLESFQKYADDFKEQYFQTEDEDIDLGSRQWQPSTANIEGEYWRMVESPTEEIEVLYGADLDTEVFGSGFPKVSPASTDSKLDERYVKSCWNLNNASRLPGSVLAYESGNISGIQVPWLYIGMCFSSFCWHVEDHHLYSLNYLHWGAQKIWYGIPGRDALKLEAAMKKHLSYLFEEQPDLLHKLVTQFSPTLLKMEGVPIYRCVQNSGEFVLTFPRAYHSGFSCGFNCAEAVNIAPFDWLPHGQSAIELYREQRRKISISHDKLLLRAAAEAVRAQWDILLLGKDIADNSRLKDVCGLDSVLVKALKGRIELERLGREYLCCSSQSRKMTDSFIANTERECVVCHYDLHLTAVGCLCSPDRFTCLIHAKELCSCPWKTRFFLFRYEISELNVLVDALEGKSSAIHRWGISELGLSSSPYATKGETHVSELTIINPLCGTKGKEANSVNEGSSSSSELSEKTCMIQLSLLEEPNRKVYKALSSDDSTGTVGVHSPSCQHPEPIVEKPSPQARSLSGIVVGHIIQATEGQRSSDLKSSGLSGSLPCQEGVTTTSILQGSPVENSINSNVTVLAASKKIPADADVIILSDDENEGHEELARSMNQEWKNLEASPKLPKLDDNITFSGSEKVNTTEIPKSNTSETCQNDFDCLPNQYTDNRFSSSIFSAVKEQQKGQAQPEGLFTLSNPQMSTSNRTPSTIHNEEHTSLASPIVDATDQHIVNFARQSEKAQLSGGCLNCIGEGKELLSEGKESESSSTSSPSSLHRSGHLEKGPCMAKVVHGINCNVQPLEYGVVLAGKLWSSSQAIFPKGYKSRVQYLSILDPTQMCDYISEILDAGLLRPLFMVTPEQSPSEVFIHVSASKCWEMVRERVNNEISRLQRMGRFNLPSLQPPESIDGLKMFGLSSPAIMQAIEVMDHNRVCTEYWKAKATIPSISSSMTISRDYKQSPDGEKSIRDPSLPASNNMVFGGLLKKANPEELDVLYSLISADGAESVASPFEEATCSTEKKRSGEKGVIIIHTHIPISQKKQIHFQHNHSITNHQKLLQMPTF